jgi:hypothetical protein
MANIKQQLKDAGVTGELVADYKSGQPSSYGSYKGLQDARKAALEGVKTGSTATGGNVVFDAPGYQEMSGQTTPTLTPTELSNVQSKIKGSGSYTPSSAVDSSDGVAELIAQYKKQIDGLNKQIKDTSNYYYTQQGEYQNALTDAEKALKKKGAKTGSEIGDQTQPDALGGQLDYVNSELLKVNRDLTDMYDKTLTEMTKFGRTMDETNQGTLASIRDTYARRKEQQIQENNATIAGLGVAGIRSGRTRYAPEMQDMLISEQERANITKLTEIDAEENKAILEATKAFDEDNFELFIKKMQTIESARKSKADTVQQLYDNSVKYDNQLLQRKQEKRLQESQDFNKTVDMAKLFAPTVLNQMTGNKKQDDAMLQAYAIQMGIDPEFLRGAVQTAVYEEAQAAKERAYKNAGSKGDTFSFEDTVSFGLPTSLVGTPKDKVAADLSSPVAPWWFVNEVKTNSGKPDVKATDETVVNLWTDYRDTIKSQMNSPAGNMYDPSSFNLNPQTEAPTATDTGGGWWDSFTKMFSTKTEDNNVSI